MISDFWFFFQFAALLVPLFGLHHFIAAFRPDNDDHPSISCGIDIISAIFISFQVKAKTFGFWISSLHWASEVRGLSSWLAKQFYIKKTCDLRSLGKVKPLGWRSRNILSKLKVPLKTLPFVNIPRLTTLKSLIIVML